MSQSHDQVDDESRYEVDQREQDDTLNSLDHHDAKPDERVHDRDQRGSNFQSSNAFDESIQESPIRKRYDVDGTLMMEKNSFIGQTPLDHQSRRDTEQKNETTDQYDQRAATIDHKDQEQDSHESQEEISQNIENSEYSEIV